MLLTPGVRVIAADWLPEVTVVPLTLTVAVVSATVGVMVTEVTVEATAVV